MLLFYVSVASGQTQAKSLHNIKLPITNFNISEMGDEEFMRCWSLDNLQPMWGIENIKKSNKI